MSIAVLSSHRRVFMSSSFLLLVLGAATTHAQQSSARNVFWSASDLVQVSENPGKAVTTPANLNPPRKKPAPVSSSPARPHVDTELVARNGYGRQPQLVSVSEEQIGLRYALLLRDSVGHYGEISPTTIFHNGDHIRLSIMANQPGYLYVIQQGSSGNWALIFPKVSADPTVGEPNNRIEQGRVYQVPDGKGAFRFDQTPGEEKLFLVLSREKIQDLEGTIDKLKHPSATPSESPRASSAGELVEAANHIPDAFVQSLSSRDLTLVEEEQVDDSKKGDVAGEKAVYVVSKASSSKGESPRVVASVTLHHE